MTTRVALDHKTSYRYDRPVQLGPQIVRLRPAPHTRTPILSYKLDVTPKQHFINWQQDPLGNYQARLVFTEKTRELIVEVELVADMTPINPFDFFLEPYAEHFPFDYEPHLHRQVQQYLEKEPAGPLLSGYLANIDRSRRPLLDALVQLNGQLRQDVAYLIRPEPGVQTCEETLERKAGSCRDSSWLLVQILRHLGISARFVSGYLIQMDPDEDVPERADDPAQQAAGPAKQTAGPAKQTAGPAKQTAGPAGQAAVPAGQAEFPDLHAWVEVYLPGAGWVGLDPTSGLLAGEGHIPLVCTIEPSYAAPITGTAEPCKTRFDFEMNIRRLDDVPP